MAFFLRHFHWKFSWFLYMGFDSFFFWKLVFVWVVFQISQWHTPYQNQSWVRPRRNIKYRLCISSAYCANPPRQPNPVMSILTSFSALFDCQKYYDPLSNHFYAGPPHSYTKWLDPFRFYIACIDRCTKLGFLGESPSGESLTTWTRWDVHIARVKACTHFE